MSTQSSEDVQLHARSVTFNVNYTNWAKSKLSFSLKSVFFSITFNVNVLLFCFQY